MSLYRPIGCIPVKPRKRVYIKRVCRETGTTVILASPGIEADESEGWATICDDHGGIVHHTSRRLAEQWMSHPKDWCPTCQEKRDETAHDSM